MGLWTILEGELAVDPPLPRDLVKGIFSNKYLNEDDLSSRESLLRSLGLPEAQVAAIAALPVPEDMPEVKGLSSSETAGNPHQDEVSELEFESGMNFDPEGAVSFLVSVCDALTPRRACNGELEVFIELQPFNWVVVTDNAVATREFPSSVTKGAATR
jgi:hypothetical protein